MIKHPDDRSGGLPGPFIRDTPRTDAVVYQCIYLGRKVPDAIEALARHLERELAEMAEQFGTEIEANRMRSELAQGGRDPLYPSGGREPLSQDEPATDSPRHTLAQLAAKRARLIRLRDVIGITGLSKSSIWRRINNGDFPKPVSLGTMCTRWVESEVNDWVEKKIKERK